MEKAGFSLSVGNKEAGVNFAQEKMGATECILVVQKEASKIADWIRNINLIRIEENADLKPVIDMFNSIKRGLPLSKPS